MNDPVAGSALISVVTPSFNQAGFIERTLDSILSQAGPLELLVIDGGSTDGTVAILERYAREHPGVFSFVSEPDRGQSDAINKGMARTSGQILAYLNADDEYEPGAFAAVREFFAANPGIAFAYGHYAIIDEQGREIRKLFRRYKHFVGRRFSYAKLLRLNPVPQPAAFWRRAVYEACGDFDEKHHLVMDYEFWCRIARRFPARQVRRVLARYRFYASSKSGAQYARQFREEYEVAKRYAAGRYPFSIAWHYLHYLRTVAVYKLLAALGR